MRKFLISAAVAVATLTAAAPAAAQWAPQHGYGYGHNYNDRGQARYLLNRVERLKDHINRLDSRNVITERESDRLKGEANDIRRLIRRVDDRGLNSRERYAIERRITALEHRIQRDARDGNRWGDRRW